MREPIYANGWEVGSYDRSSGNLILDTYGSIKGRILESDKCVVDNYGTIVGYYDYYGDVVDRNRNIVGRYSGNPVEAAAMLLRL